MISLNRRIGLRGYALVLVILLSPAQAAINRGRIWFKVATPASVWHAFSGSPNGTAGFNSQDSVYLTRSLGPGPEWIRIGESDLEGTGIPRGFRPFPKLECTDDSCYFLTSSGEGENGEGVFWKADLLSDGTVSLTKLLDSDEETNLGKLAS